MHTSPPALVPMPVLVQSSSILVSEIHTENVAGGGNEIFQKFRGHLTYLY